MRTSITRAVCGALAAAALASLGFAGSGTAGAAGAAPQARVFLPSVWQAAGTVHSTAGQARPTGPVTAYVVNDVNDNSGTVTPIRTATNTALKPITVGHSPDAIAITPDGKTAYVANFASGTVTPIHTATNTALKPIAVDGGPTGIAITPDGKTAYVLALGFGVVTPIRTATNTALTPITLGYGPAAIAFTPDSKTAYVVNISSDTVTPIRTATNTALKPIKLTQSATNPDAIVITPDGRMVYVANSHTTPRRVLRSEVTPIRTATNTALKPITAGFRAPPFGALPLLDGGLAVTPNGQEVYVPNSDGNRVTPIRTATNTALTAIKVGSAPIAIAITP